MPFTETSVMHERVCFVVACLRGEEPMALLCARYGISRKTGYKWLRRYQEAGAAGLADRSRAPRTVSHGVAPEVAEQILLLRQRHPTWGPRKLLARLRQDAPEVAWPAASTAGDLLKRQGLVSGRTRRHRAPGAAGPVFAPASANESWSADFKGWFRTRDGVRCEPLTISDNYSRYLFACQAVPRVGFAQVQPHFERVFREHGLPQALRTDNGAPFAHRFGLGGLTRLSVWLLKLDVWPDRIAVGRPDQNGRHERMHRTLAQDTASPPADTLALQQARFDEWREVYNTVRPHEALGQRSPGQVHCRSARAYPEVLRPWEYPPDHHVRRVNAKGYFRWRDGVLYLSEALAREKVALVQNDSGDWIIRYRGFDLAILDDRLNDIRSSGLARSGQT